MAAFAVVLILAGTLHIFTPAPLPEAEEVVAAPVEDVVEVQEATTPMTFVRKALGRKEAKLPPVVVRRAAVVKKYRKARAKSSWAARVKEQNRIRTNDYRTIYAEGVNADFGRYR
ncbi:MAG: hypothetical protein ACXW13_00150 [Burkholderiaceae bacterium]